MRILRAVISYETEKAFFLKRNGITWQKVSGSNDKRFALIDLFCVFVFLLQDLKQDMCGIDNIVGSCTEIFVVKLSEYISKLE